MNARQLTRTGIVLMGVYILVSGVGAYAFSLGITSTGAGAPLLLVITAPGILLIALSNWASRRLEQNESPPVDANHGLYVGLFLLGVYFTTLAASDLVSNGLLLAKQGGLFPEDTPFGRQVRIHLVTAVLKAALGVTVCVVATKLANRLDGGEDRKSWLLTGTQLLGTYFIVLGVVGLMGCGVEHLQLPSEFLPDMPVRGELGVRLVESVAQCVLGALLFLRPQQLLRFKTT